MYQHQYHLVWWTKYRRQWLKPYVLDTFLSLTEEIQEKYPTLEFLTVNGDEDHVHIQMIIPPDLSIAEVVQKIKTYTSLRLRKKFKFINKIYIGKEGIWSVGYFSSTIGINEETIRKYIEHQGKKDIPAPINQSGLEFS